MKSFFNKLMPIFLLSVAGLAACSDDVPDNSGEPDGEDKFQGSVKELFLGPEAKDFKSQSFTLAILAPDGSVIFRDGSHLRSGSNSKFTLTTGLSEGVYRLLYFEYPITDNPDIADLASEFKTAQYGLGSRVEVKNGHINVLDAYDEELDLPGKGTAEEPYEISSYHSLLKLAQAVNSEERNGLITKDTHFRQTGKIDLYQASREADRRYGWLPIGANSALPFRGHYHGAPLSTLVADRPNSAGIGLFGYVNDASIYDVTLTNSAVTGNFAVGGIVGASLMGGNNRGLLTMTGCSAKGCEINGSDESAGVGGLLGMIDLQSRAFLSGCSSEDNTISSSYNAGGLVGGSALYSSVSFASCQNTSAVTTGFSGAGGLIGTCDTIQAATSWNTGRISGAVNYSDSDLANSGIGAGGLVGGVGAATLSSCYNRGEISGYAGVGGLVGSGRVKGSDSEAYMYNNVMLRYCYNEGEISGQECIGGLTGEAQVGTYAVYNKGNVKGSRYVAGIAGCTSVSVAHNAINCGKIEGKDYVAGIVGKTQFGSLALDHNYGELTASGTHLGGVVALAGNNTMINSCGNFGNLTSSSNGPVGGIVGEVGDPRVWTAMNYAECVIGSVEIFMGLFVPTMVLGTANLPPLNHTLEIFLHMSEVSIDLGCQLYDAISWGKGLEEMFDNEMITEMSADIQQKVGEINTDVKRAMASLRASDVYTFSGFDKTTLTSGYPGFVNSNLDFYEADGGDISFNEKINYLREQREKSLEKSHHRDEIIHQCVGGVCIVVGAVATIGGAIATGGAAVPFMLAGAAASVAGGLNAITKTCLEFEENVVIISQCVNTGSVTAPKGSDAAGLVGRLQDNSILRDCLNMGEGPGYGSPFIAHAGNEVSQQRLLSLCDYDSWGGGDDLCTVGMQNCALWNDSVKPEDNTDHGSWRLLCTFEQVSDPETYKKIDSSWNIGGEDSLWKIGTGNTNSFPVPAWSEMTKE